MHSSKYLLTAFTYIEAFLLLLTLKQVHLKSQLIANILLVKDSAHYQRIHNMPL